LICYAFLYHTEETAVSINGSGTAVLICDFMPVVPAVTTTAETTLRWTVDGEFFHKTVSAGTWEIPELELRHGENTVSVSGEGTTTFKYREGRL
jgi:hypothetical protein